jgi:hypothetical protein
MLSPFETTGSAEVHRRVGWQLLGYRNGMLLQLQLIWIPAALLFMTACGNDDNGNGNEDTLFTGFSGVVILVLIVWFLVRRSRKG